MKEAEVDENDENNEADAEDEPKGVKSPQKSKKKRKLKKSKGFIGTSYPFINDTYRISMNSFYSQVRKVFMFLLRRVKIFATTTVGVPLEAVGCIFFTPILLRFILKSGYYCRQFMPYTRNFVIFWA